MLEIRPEKGAIQMPLPLSSQMKCNNLVLSYLTKVLKEKKKNEFSSFVPAVVHLKIIELF